jgi:hypothetical protein
LPLSYLAWHTAFYYLGCRISFILKYSNGTAVKYSIGQKY